MNKELRTKMANLPFEKKVEMARLLRRFIHQERSFKNRLEEVECELFIKEMKLKGRKLHLQLEGQLSWEIQPLIVKGEIKLSEQDLELMGILL